MQGTFNLASAREAAGRGQTHEWVQSYLRTGEWINLGLADGLLLAPRWWIGPFEIPLDALTRKCGPEPDMEYVESLDVWRERTASMAAGIKTLEDVPPLIVERRASGWYIADGNHRHEAIGHAGFKTCWVLGWLNSEADFHAISVIPVLPQIL